MDQDTERYFELLYATIQSGFERLDTRLDGLEQRLARVEERLDRVEQRLDRIEERLDRVEERLDRLEERLGRLEARVDGMDLKFTESFLGVYDRFKSFDARLDHLSGAIADLREQVTHFGARLALVAERLDKVEDAIDALNVRVEGLAEDMRQRFRYVNDRLAELSAA